MAFWTPPGVGAGAFEPTTVVGFSTGPAGGIGFAALAVGTRDSTATKASTKPGTA
ncbi:hypothetical protein LBMAG15_00430 [Actinomycetes bacterium]|nr:hypothetical protein LBMAG15_00430 [Actinomycetes bacterium]